MKLDNESSVFNLGDTSIRIKQVVEVSHLILKQISETFKFPKTWNQKENQEEFYQDFLKQVKVQEDLFNKQIFSNFKRGMTYSYPEQSKIGMRARTLTNSLVKLGFVDSNRNLSQVAVNWLNDTVVAPDTIEELLCLDTINLIYFRQLIKLRVYSSNSNKFIYPFRIALYLLSKHNNIEQQQVLKFIESIPPDISEADLHDLIRNFIEAVRNGVRFQDFYLENFSRYVTNHLASNVLEDLHALNSKLSQEDYQLNDEEFYKFVDLFANRKSKDTARKYLNLVISSFKFAKTPNIETLTELRKIASLTENKRAFANGRSIFIDTKHASLEQFINSNSSNPLLSLDLAKIFYSFKLQKKLNLIDEYSDVCKRIFEISGVVSFTNGQISLENSLVIEATFNSAKSNIPLCGEESYSDYEQDEDSIWFKDISSSEILGLTRDDLGQLVNNLQEKYDLTDLQSVQEWIRHERERNFVDFIKEKFPKEKVIQILEYINNRDDERVFDEVTPNATVPTVFEYILTIAWYHLTRKPTYSLSESFKVSLDSNKLPISHRPGGNADIEIVNDEYALALEATLLNKHNQRRSELEPVLRHSINFCIEHDDKENLAIFIANELDVNLVNMLMSTKNVELVGSSTSKTVSGMHVFALTTQDVIKLLKNGVSDKQIVSCIKNELNNSGSYISLELHQKIINKLYSL